MMHGSTKLKFMKVLFIHKLEALVNCLKKTLLEFTLKFTLKQLGHVSVLQLDHYQRAH